MTSDRSAVHRCCEICGSNERTLLYEQRFVPFDDGSTLSGYDIVVCVGCGHGYADRLPPQDFYDRYYRDMSKYEAFRSGSAVDATHPSYAEVAAALVPHFPDRGQRILDIGTGAGHMLGALKNQGYRSLLGIDPSPQCSVEANERYGVPVVATPISQMAFAGEQFDLVLLTSVIEHLRDAIASLREAASLVAPGGAIFIDAPDAGRFGEFVAAPFQQFSLEHINYFAAPSLENVFHRIGFGPVAIWQDVRYDGPVAEPALSGLFRNTIIPGTGPRDDVTEHALRNYIDKSHSAEAELARPLAELRRNATPVIVWGVGTLTLRLLATDAFRELNIVAFVDSNTSYHGKCVGGVPVLPPENLHDRPETILIASRAHQLGITKQIRQQLGLKNRVVTLFGEL